MADYRGKKMEKYLGASRTNSTSSASSSDGGVRVGSSSLNAAEDILWEHAQLSGGEDGSVSSTFRLPDITHFSRPSNVPPYTGKDNFQPTQYNQGAADALPEPWELVANFPLEVTDHVSALDHLWPFTGGFDTPSYSPFCDLNRPVSHNIPMGNHSRITNSASGGPLRNIGVIGDGRTCLASDTRMANATQEAPPRQLAQAANAYAPHMRVAGPSAGRPPRSPHVAPVKSHDVGTARTILDISGRHQWRILPNLTDGPLQRLLPTDAVSGRSFNRPVVWTQADSRGRHQLDPKQPVVRHARHVSTPAIGTVRAFVRTPESFLDFPAPEAHGGSATGAPIVIHRPLPALPLPVARTNTTPSAPIPVPHRCHGIPKSRPVRIPDARSSPTTLNPNRSPLYPTNAAVADHGSAQGINLDRFSDLVPNRSQFSDQYPLARPSTRGMTYLPTVGSGSLPPPPPQQPYPTYAIGPAIDCSNSNTFKPRINRRPAATDPQSLYARHQRNRINERLNILQQLIPNGNEVVNLVHMLDEAFNYIKFLEHQLALLYSNDEWMLSLSNTFKLGKHHKD